MPGEAIRLGPFAGGINTLSDAAALSDQELLDIINFELDLDGSLLNRPPISLGIGVPSSTAPMNLLTYGVFSNIPYLIGSNAQGVWHYLNGVWTLITDTIIPVVAVQWQDKVWLPAQPGSANPGGYWTPAGGWVTVAALPKCTCLVAHKERLFAAGMSEIDKQSLITYSKATDGTVWDVGSNITVQVGDGETIVEMIIYMDALTIFKQNSTFVYPFDVTPATGILRRISGTIGCPGKNCVLLYEQGLYVLHERNVYEVINYDFSRLNVKVPFVYDPTAPAPFITPFFLTLVGDRLIVRFYGRIYAFGFRTRTWARWETAKFFGPFQKYPGLPTGVGLEIYTAGSALQEDASIFQILDGISEVTEPMTCTLVTKIYDLAISAKYKRLFWWGADVNTVNPVKGTIIPITSVFTATWQDLASRRWNELATWQQPTTVAPSISITVPVGAGGVRRFLKFLKGIRFRQVQFVIEMTTTGAVEDSPARFFYLTAFISTKQTVVKAVS